MPIEKIDTERCTGCEICVDGCPMDVIRFDKEAKKALIRYEKDCIACYNCERIVLRRRSTYHLIEGQWFRPRGR